MEFINVLLQFWPSLLHGLGLTLLLTGLSAVLAGAISLPLAVFRTNASTAAQLPLRIYISFMRGTPLLGQLFLVYYGSGQFRGALQEVGLWSFFRDPFNCAVLTFTLNSIAYQIEILRGGLMGVPRGQVEAAKAVGMSQFQVYRRVILPHAYRIAQPALGNEIILLMKGSAVASVITIFDLMGETKTDLRQDFRLLDLSVGGDHLSRRYGAVCPRLALPREIAQPTSRRPCSGGSTPPCHGYEVSHE